MTSGAALGGSSTARRSTWRRTCWAASSSTRPPTAWSQCGSPRSRPTTADLDPGSHAFRGQTPRNAVMFGAARLRVRLLHLRHALLHESRLRRRPVSPSAVLLRAGEVVDGADLAAVPPRRRAPHADLARGPARLTVALGSRSRRRTGSTRASRQRRCGCAVRRRRSPGRGSRPARGSASSAGARDAVAVLAGRRADGLDRTARTPFSADAANP